MEEDSNKDLYCDRRRKRRRSRSRSPGRVARVKRSRSGDGKRSHSRVQRGIQDAHQRRSILVAAKKPADVSETFADVKLGIAGCNKIENPSYMDGGDDRKEEKILEDKESVSILKSSSNATVAYDCDVHNWSGNYLALVERLLSDSKKMLIIKEQAVEKAKKAVEDAKKSIELDHATLDTLEKSAVEMRSEIGDTLYYKIFGDSSSRRKKLFSASEKMLPRREDQLERAKEAVKEAEEVVKQFSKILDNSKRSLGYDEDVSQLHNR